jgi:hypothetical protein
VFRATVTSGATGTVTFADGTAILGTAVLDASGKAAIPSTLLSAGTLYAGLATAGSPVGMDAGPCASQYAATPDHERGEVSDHLT